MSDDINKGSKLVEYNLPTILIQRMKKLSKIRGHSVDDEFAEAMKTHMVEDKEANESPLKNNKSSISIEEHFEKNQDLKKTLDTEMTEAVKKHLKKHTNTMK